MKFILIIDSFLIDQVFQPILDAFGVGPRWMATVANMVFTLGLLVSIALGWTERGTVDWLSIISMFAASATIWNWFPGQRFMSLMLLIRMTVLVSTALNTISLFSPNVPVGTAAQILETAVRFGTTFALLCAGYFAACRNPPPRGRIAFSLAG